MHPILRKKDHSLGGNFGDPSLEKGSSGKELITREEVGRVPSFQTRREDFLGIPMKRKEENPRTIRSPPIFAEVTELSGKGLRLGGAQSKEPCTVDSFRKKGDKTKKNAASKIHGEKPGIHLKRNFADPGGEKGTTPRVAHQNPPPITLPPTGKFLERKGSTEFLP